MMHNPKVLVKILLLLGVSILAAILGGVPASEQQPANESLSVCDVLTKTHRYRHRVVEIRGELRVGRHGAALVGERCEALKPDRIPAVCITAAGDVNAPEVAFRSNTAILDPVLTFQRTLGELDAQFHSLAILEGQLFFEDERGGVGFCHMNAYPALMVVKDIKYYSLWRDGTAATRQGTRAGAADYGPRLKIVPERRPDLTTLEEQIQRAISLWGEGNDAYGAAIIECACLIDSDFTAAFRAIWNYLNP